MYRHILIPTDGSALAAKGVDAGLTLAKECGARVTLLTAVPRYRPLNEDEARTGEYIPAREHHRRSQVRADRVLAAPVALARAAGVDCDALYLENDRPYQAILDAAELRKCDLIVMSSHGRSGLAALWHGSQTRDVLTRSRIPTLVYR